MKLVLKSKINEYNYDIEVVHERLDKNRVNLSEVEIYYETKYNNISFLDSKLSKWGLFEQTRKLV